MRVAYSGVEGAFANIVAERIFPDAVCVGYKDFAAAYNAVVNGECDCAVLPIEKSFNGDVSKVMDLSFFGSLFVNGVYEAEITQNLLGVKGAKIEDIKTVISHSQALGQCAAYIEKLSLNTQEAVNTAVAAKMVAEKGDKKAARVIRLSEDYDNLISTILIGNNIVNILASSLATLFFISVLNGDQSLGSTVSTIVMTAAVLIFGEISPKTMAKNSPDAFASFSAPIIAFLEIILFPITIIFRGWQALLAKLFKSNDDEGITEEELISIIEEAEEEGDIDKEESDLIKSAIEFGDLEVGDIFTPRIDLTALPVTSSKEVIAKTFTESGYSRIPMYDGDIDNIVGIVYIVIRIIVVGFIGDD